MSTTNEDWELKEGKLHFHGNFVKNKNFKEFNFIKKDFKSTISKKEEAQFLHQRFKILAHVLKENLSPNFYESEVTIAHPKPSFSNWTDFQWLGFSRKGTFANNSKETIQFQVTIHPKDKQNNALHVDLWLDGKANETRLRMLDQIKNNREIFSEILKNISGTYFIGIQKSRDDKEIVEISKINPQFIENIIERLTKKGTEFFIRKYYSEEEAINQGTKIINNIVDTFEKLIPASEFLNGNPNKKTLTFEEENQSMEKYSEYLDILNWEKNLILYGPPGTGKTYTADKIAQEKIRKNKQMTWKNCALSILLDNKGMVLPYKKITQRIIKDGLRTSDIPTPEETVRRDIDEDIKNNNDSFFLKSSTRGEYGLKIPLTFMDAAKLVLTVNDSLHYDRITEICKNKN